MRMKRYKQYKPTGISWLPEIPAHWDLAQLRKYLSLVSVKGKGDKQLLSVTREKGVIVRNVDDLEENHNFVPEDLSGYKYVQPGQFVINKMKSWQGSYGVSEYEGIVSPAYYVCNLSFPNKTFFSKAIRSRAYVDFFAQWSKGIRVGQWDLEPIALKSIPFFEPPIEEQEKIVAFLDKQITLIESCKCQRERELQTLNELKQAEIASAVTRGLNPNAPMKDSGQIQFGEIPAHWDSVKMKYCFTQRSEKGFPNEPVLCATQSKGVIPQSLYENRVVVVNKGFEGLKLVKVGDFVISLRSFQGGIEYAYYQGIISAAYTILTPKDERNSQYFKYLFKSHPFIQLLQTCVTGIREGQNINYAVLGNNFIPIPPIEEQNAIVEYIEAKMNSIDKMIDALKAEIDRLTEYKQRLISDVVTGQLNVQDEIA